MRHLDLCAYLSNQAYEDHIDLVGYESLFLSNKGAQAHIVYDETKVFVAFRGTSEGEDIIADAKFWRKNGVHAGFLEQFKALENKINSVLLGLLASRGILIFTGHSLGGSLAMIAAEASPFRTSIRRVFTFGAAKPGGRAFRKRYRALYADTWSVINVADPVPRFQVLKVNPGQKILLDRDVFKLRPSSFRLWWSFVRSSISQKTKAHSMSTYLRNLKLNWSKICEKF